MKLSQFVLVGLLFAGTLSAQAVEPTKPTNAQPTSTVVKSTTVKEIKKDTKPAFSGKVNLNTATAKELQQLNGIGASKAKAIINYRKKIGGFKKIEQLKEVKGIGEELFNKNKAHLGL